MTEPKRENGKPITLDELRRQLRADQEELLMLYARMGVGDLPGSGYAPHIERRKVLDSRVWNAERAVKLWEELLGGGEESHD